MGHSLISEQSTVWPNLYFPVYRMKGNANNALSGRCSLHCLYFFPGYVRIIINRTRTDYADYYGQMVAQCLHPTVALHRWRIHPHNQFVFQPSYQQRKIGYLHVEYHQFRHYPVNNHAPTLSIRCTYHDYSVCIHQYLLAVCMALYFCMATNTAQLVRSTERHPSVCLPQLLR